MGNPGQFNYTAAKGAIIAITKTLARELGPFGITVNAYCPGIVRTPIQIQETIQSDEDRVRLAYL